MQDASNQTDTPICSEDDNTIHTLPEVVAEVKTKPPALQEPIVEDSSRKAIEIVEPETSEATPKPVEGSEESLQPETTGVIQEEPKEEVLDTPPQEPTQPPKPDLSGLELLSNSIVEFENCRKSAVKQETETKQQRDDVLKGIAHMTLKDTESETVIVKNVDDNLGGLNLLCALAEQRIMEEVVQKNKSQNELKLERSERKKEKRKSKKHHDEPKRKKIKVSDENKFFEDRIKSQDKQKETETKCSCAEENYRAFRSPESAEEVRKFIASKSQNTCCKGEWPCMNAMELDMRMRLADLQRQYREKQKELSKLKPKKHASDCSKKKSRKKSTHSDRSATPPPLLDKMDVPVKPNKNIPELLKPPTLCAETIKIPKLEPVKHITIKASYESPHKRYESPGPELSDSTPEKRSSSKKRKVGRPKKLLSSSGLHIPTETIVAKKPKKGSLVGYLLAAKEKLKLQNKNGFLYSDSPPRYIEEPAKVKHKSHKNKNNNNILSKSYMETENSCKIRPKLKAEPKIKMHNEEEDIKNESEVETENEMEEEDEEEEEDDMNDEEIVEEVEETKDSIMMDLEPQPELEQPNEIKIVAEPAKQVDTRCILTAEHLETDKLRVLTAMGGLFYAGHLNAVEPPDVYSITLDGERGNRPHIMSREEILRDAVRETPKIV